MTTTKFTPSDKRHLREIKSNRALYCRDNTTEEQGRVQSLTFPRSGGVKVNGSVVTEGIFWTHDRDLYKFDFS